MYDAINLKAKEGEWEYKLNKQTVHVDNAKKVPFLKLQSVFKTLVLAGG